MTLWLLRAAFALYLLATAFAFAYLYSRDEKLPAWMRRLLASALTAQLASFALLVRAFWLVPENRFFFPINSFFGALSWLALTNAFVFFLVEGSARLGILGAFVLPWTCLAAGAALFQRPELGPLAPSLQSFRLNLHPMILMLSSSALANAFGVGIALLIQDRQIKSRKPSELCYRLPPIEDLDKLHYRIIALIFPVYTVGLLMGSFWAYSAWSSFWTDAKVLAAALTWAVYGLYLYLHAFGGFRGRKSVQLAMAGFACVLITFVAVNYLSSRHGFLYGR